MRGIFFSVGLVLTSAGLALTACGSSSQDDTPAAGHGGTEHGGAAGSGAAAATAGSVVPEAGMGGTAEAGTSGSSEAGEGGALVAGAGGSAEAGESGEGGATNMPSAGNANAGTGATPNGGTGGSAGGIGGTGGSVGGTGGTGGSAGGATCPTQLLVGGSDIAAQGWFTRTLAPATVSYGADYVRLETSTNSGASSGGQLLLYYPAAFPANQAFKIKVELLVESVSPHNLLDSGAAILGSFTSSFGSATDRSQMVYLDSAALGWSDDTLSAVFPVTDGAYHSYVLSVNATGLATVSVDGTVKLARTGYTSNGTLAIGDQTNDAKVDGALRIRSVTRECP